LPSLTFFHLPEDKKEKILRAIKDEFARVPFNQVSINKIIQAAGISRGSFYQYFADKSDMLAYVMSDYQRQLLARVKENLRASGGDIFKVFSDILDFSLEFVTEQKTNQFCMNLFADIAILAGLISMQSQNEVQTILRNELTPFVDIDPLDLRSDRDLPIMIEILSSLTRDTIAAIFLDLSSQDITIEKYQASLALMKRGFSKCKE
jgi:AcrR family transcriptional regulator